MKGDALDKLAVSLGVVGGLAVHVLAFVVKVVIFAFIVDIMWGIT